MADGEDLAKSDSGEVDPFERAKRPMLGAALGIAIGLAVAGSADRNVGGAIVLGSWALGVAALHRLGRAGSAPRSSR